MDDLSYVLMTAAKNEEKYIGRTIISVINQTVLPIRWIIVSDGSTDKTDDIIQEFSGTHTFISLIRKNKSSGHNFSSKVEALQTAYKQLSPLSFSLIGNLDADIELPSDFYKMLIEKFKTNPKLGIASGLYINSNTMQYEGPLPPLYHTSGSTQFFRRECWEQIGGYPVINGGEDTIVGIIARLKGWDTLHFPDLKVLHLKTFGKGQFFSASRNMVRAGMADYHFGMVFYMAILKFMKRLIYKPYIWGAICFFYGYLKSALLKKEKLLSEEIIKYYRQEQTKKMQEEIAQIFNTP